MNIDLSAWKIKVKDFPHDGNDADKLTFCLKYAILAPSAHNRQPWYFKIEKNKVFIYADRRYALPVIDPDDRELSISCGAALYTLRLALNYFGYEATTDILPIPEDSDCLASVKLGDKMECAEKDKSLFKAITKRHTNNYAFTNREIPEDTLDSLKKAAMKEGGWLHICTPGERSTVMNMIMEADHIQTGDKHFRRELAAWTDPRRALSDDGLPNLELSYDNVIKNLTPSVARRPQSDDNKPVSNHELTEDNGVIVILGTKKGGIIERIKAGQSYMRTWLLAEHEGLSVTPLNQPCEVPEIRLRLHDEMAPHGRAHVVMRLGYSNSKPSFTPRRPLSSFLDEYNDVSNISNGGTIKAGKPSKKWFRGLLRG